MYRLVGFCCIFTGEFENDLGTAYVLLVSSHLPHAAEHWHTWVLWHEFGDVVSFSVNDYPAVFVIVVFRNLLAAELLPLRLLLVFVIHLVRGLSYMRII